MAEEALAVRGAVDTTPGCRPPRPYRPSKGDRRTGVWWDNAQSESFWSTLKTEFYDRYSFASRTEAIHATRSWIKNAYNRRRRHSTLGRIPPVALEHRTITADSEAA
jgi:putative transposase